MVFRRIAKDSAIYGGADLASKVVAFFTFPLIAAALSPLAFGALELIRTSVSLLGLVLQCGLNNSVQRFYWDKDTKIESRPVIVSSGFAAQIAFGLLTIIIGALCIPFIYPLLQDSKLPVTYIALIFALLLAALMQWHQYILDVTRLHFKPFKFMILELLTKILKALLGLVVVVFLGWGVDGFISVQAITLLAVLPLGFVFIKKDITRKIDSAWTKTLVGFGYPFIFAGIAYWLFGSIDRWMLASMTSVDEVGIYSVAFRFATVVFFASKAFGQAWSPMAMKVRTDNPDKYRSIYAQVFLLLLYIMLAIGGGLALFSGEIIALIMPKEYALSSLPLSILCFGVVLQSTQQVTAVGISLERKTFLFARLAWFTAAINVALNWVLIRYLGAVGASIATSISYLVLTGSYLYFTQRLHPLPIPWKKLGFILGLGVCIVCVSITMNTNIFSWSLIAIKLLIAVICLILGWMSLPVRRLNFGR